LAKARELYDEDLLVQIYTKSIHRLAKRALLVELPVAQLSDERAVFK
jgi:hypothetical protein